MNAKSRRKIEMGERVLQFSEKHTDPSPGYAAVVAQLKERVARADQLPHQQQDGRTEVRAATKLKKELRQVMLEAHLHHLANVAELAEVEDPEVRQKLAFPADATTYLAFRTAASGMAAEAESRKDLLMKHGLSEEVLTDLRVNLDRFETALEQGSAGRLSHVGATAELVSVAEEIAQIVKVMNGLVRVRFANQPELLAAWESASNVVTIVRSDTKPVAGGTTPPTGTTPPSGTIPPTGTTPSAGDVKPAA
jgi:hypothetical protein